MVRNVNTELCSHDTVNDNDNDKAQKTATWRHATVHAGAGDSNAEVNPHSLAEARACSSCCSSAACAAACTCSFSAMELTYSVYCTRHQAHQKHVTTTQTSSRFPAGHVRKLRNSTYMAPLGNASLLPAFSLVIQLGLSHKRSTSLQNPKSTKIPVVTADVMPAHATLWPQH